MRGLFAGLAMLIAAPAGQGQGRDLVFEKEQAVNPGRRAFLIGNDDYKQARRLKNAGKDAKDLEAALKKLGFATTLRLDANTAQMRAGLEQFAAGTNRGDIVFFFYAGHGVQIDGANYMAPTDFAAMNEADAKRAGLELGKVQAMLQSKGAGLTIMVIDACRNNPLGDGKEVFRNGFAPMRTGAGGLIAFSTGPGQRADDGSGAQNGLYTSQLLKVLAEPIPVIGVFRHARDMVFEVSGGAQRPYVMEDVIGDHYLTRVAGQAPTPRDTPARIDAQVELNRGLQQYSAADYAGAAKSFGAAMKIQPTDAYAYNAAGLAEARQEHFQVAADLFSKAISLNPAYAAAYLNRGSVFLAVPHYDLAVQDFTWATEFDPNDPVALTQRGKAYVGARKYEEARSDFQRALELYPGDFEAHYGLGVTCYQLNLYKDALTHLNEAIRLKTDFAQAQQYRTRTLEKLGRR